MYSSLVQRISGVFLQKTRKYDFMGISRNITLPYMFKFRKYIASLSILGISVQSIFGYSIFLMGA